MIRIKAEHEIDSRLPMELAEHMRTKIKQLTSEYDLNDLTDVGCFLYLERNESEYLDHVIPEFSEYIVLGNTKYYHCVSITGDGYSDPSENITLGIFTLKVRML